MAATVVNRPRRVLMVACGALAREIGAVIAANGLRHVSIRCLPATLHNRPERIAGAVQAAIRAARAEFESIFVAYADCGTGGALDRVLAEEGVGRLPGAHCYAFYSGVERFAAGWDADCRSFFLTDFLARQFQTLVIEPLGLDRHPELRDAYFRNYEKVVYLAQTRDAELLAMARSAAARLELAFAHRYVGYGELGAAIAAL